MSEPTILVLGPMAVVRDSELKAVRGQQGEVLAAVVAAHPHPVAIDALIEAIWAGKPTRTARTGLSVVISRLRALLAGLAELVHDGGGYRLEVGPDQIDAQRFAAVAAEVAAPVEALADALDLWRGEAFQPSSDSDLVRGAAVRLAELKLTTEERLVDGLLIHDPDSAAVFASGFAEAEPYRERRWEQLMLALYRASRQGEALRVGARARRLLRDELGVDPGPSFVALEADILQHAGHLMDLGQAPSATADETGLATLLAGARRSAERIPNPGTALVGRAAALHSLEERMGQARMVTIVGAAGAGKTRLAAEYARSERARRVVWIDLVHVDDALLVEEIADQLGVNDRTTSLADAVIAELRASPTLLVLDNVEHVVDTMAPLVGALLQACAELAVLATGRVAIGVAEETTLTLGPLEADDAMALLRNRLGDVVSAYPDDTLQTLVTAVDALPLGLELVAGPLRTASPAAVLDQLRHSVASFPEVSRSDHRHRSLEASIDWSVGLLSANSRALHADLGVFAAGFTANDVATVTGGSPSEVETQLAELAQHGLVSSSVENRVPRHRQPVAVRAHARGVLREAGRLGDRTERYSRAWCREVSVIGERCAGVDEAVAVDSLTRSRPQIMAAFDHLVDASDGERAARMAIELCDPAFLLQDVQLLTLPGTALTIPGIESTDSYLELLGARTFTAWLANEMEETDRLIDRSHRVAEEQGRPLPRHLLQARVNVESNRGVGDAAFAAAADLFAWTADHGDSRARADLAVLETLGMSHVGADEKAVAAAERAQALADESQNPSAAAWAAYAAGWARLPTDAVAAARYFQSSIRMADAVSNEWVGWSARDGLATVALYWGRHDQARPLLAAALAHWARVGALAQFIRALRHTVVLLAEVGDSDGARTTAARIDMLGVGQLLMPELQRRLVEAMQAIGHVDELVVPGAYGEVAASVVERLSGPGGT